MDLPLFMKGVALGFAIAAPVGPIGVVCIRKTVHFGHLSGLSSGLGAAAADAIYAIIAAFGLTFISDFLLLNHFWLRLFGGAFLIYLGLRTAFSKELESAPSPVTHKTLIADFLSTFFLTLTNPLTILSFFAVFAGLGLTQFPSGYMGPISLVGGVLIGSSLWWLMLCGGVSLFRHKISQRVMKYITIAAGISIIAFGLLAWSSLCLPFFIELM